MTATGAELIGYADRWSVQEGQAISFMVSADVPELSADLVRLIHGDEHRDGPGFVELEVQSSLSRRIPGGLKETRAGSYVVGPPLPELRVGDLTAGLWVWPALIGAAPQTICSLLDPDGRGWALSLSEAGLSLAIQGRRERRILFGPRLEVRQWAQVTVTVAPGRGEAQLHVAAWRGAGWTQTDVAVAALTGDFVADGDWPFVVAARTVGGTPDAVEVGGFFDGKIDSPWISIGDPSAEDRWRSGQTPGASVALAWDFSDGTVPSRAPDVTGHERHGRVVNAPARLMTGPDWTGEVIDPRLAPVQWSAIQFHHDDLDDALWPPSVTWTVPAKIPSGVYALRTRTDEAEDHVPFVVRPSLGRPTAAVALLLPTFTYAAYANERLLARTESVANLTATPGSYEPGAADTLLARHPEWGLSVYDVHADGSGCCYSSRLRPIPNQRPRYRFWSTGGPERFAADLYITHFLDHADVPADVFTDEDLHRDGRVLLDPYRVILTGTHPEYWSLQMLEAVESYLASGGRMMYLGGNGFYWVTSVDPERPHLIEVRRGINGTRTWTSQPGELHHSTTLEPGGLWRYRGRDPNKLVGVAFSAQSDSHEPAAGYARLPDSEDPRVAFIFEGVGRDEVIGDFGLINGGAAGYEIDRCDPSLGSPSDVLRLATSEGRHGPSYLLVVEDTEVTSVAEVTGPTSPRVRADLTYMSYPNGGAVFSVGSCNWCASLSHNDYDNNVARITSNVLSAMLEEAPGQA
jgi:N,N-dimethylformamidase